MNFEGGVTLAFLLALLVMFYFLKDDEGDGPSGGVA